MPSSPTSTTILRTSARTAIEACDADAYLATFASASEQT
jgi:hypothetical protein